MLQQSSTFRKPVRPRSEMVSSKGFVKKLKTKKPKPKPGWDSSVSDLTVYKPTDQELKRNHEIHQPKKDYQRILRKIELADSVVNFDTTCGSSFYNPESPFVARTGAISKLKFQQQKREAQALLAETDRTIIEMDDIMGNITHKYHSVPVLTQAPRMNKDVMVNEVSVLNPGDHLYYDDLIESVNQRDQRDQSSEEEENDDSSSNDENENLTNDEDGDRVSDSNFEASMNIDHYQNILKTQLSCPAVDETESLSVTDMKSLEKEFADLISENDLLNKLSNDSKDLPENPSLKIQKKKSKQDKSKTTKKEPQEKHNALGTSMDTFSDMDQILKSLEEEIVAYEKVTGKASSPIKKFRTSSFVGGYTAHLLTMILRLTQHLKESEMQLKTDMAMRKEIVDMYDDQRAVVDLLTQHIMELQVSNENLRKQMEDSNNALQQQLQTSAESSQMQYRDLKKEFNELEARFNVLFFNSDGGSRMLRKPFDDLTNENMPVWADAENFNQ